jgi:hypothetical protein
MSFHNQYNSKISPLHCYNSCHSTIFGQLSGVNNLVVYFIVNCFNYMEVYVLIDNNLK